MTDRIDPHAAPPVGWPVGTYVLMAALLRALPRPEPVVFHGKHPLTGVVAELGSERRWVLRLSTELSGYERARLARHLHDMHLMALGLRTTAEREAQQERQPLPPEPEVELIRASVDQPPHHLATLRRTWLGKPGDSFPVVYVSASAALGLLARYREQASLHPMWPDSPADMVVTALQRGITAALVGADSLLRELPNRGA